MNGSSFAHKTILVTGGAGSLGRRLTEELLKPEYSVKAIRILDNNENGLAHMRVRLQDKRLRYFLGDIGDKDRMVRAMENTDIVIHCAAQKHVDLAEINPFFSLKTNVLGTQICIDAALENNVDKFVFCSSDKAVQAISTYGRCKALSESLTLDVVNYKGDRRTKCAIIRPPNYTRSDGSMFELWDYQKAHGLPITVTDEKMYRYFMSFDQIIAFVLKCVDMMKGGEIFVPEGAERIRILDLALKVSDNIRFIGIRKGEKLEEILIDPSERDHAELVDNIWVIQ